jgi:hypothetical protein
LFESRGPDEDIWAQEGRGDKGVETNTKRGALRSVLLNKYCSGDQNKNNGVGEHVARMWQRRGYTGNWWENLRERDPLEDPGVDGRIILTLSNPIFLPPTYFPAIIYLSTTCAICWLKSVLHEEKRREQENTLSVSVYVFLF